MDEAYKCDKLALIRKGKIIAQGSVNEIVESCRSKDIEEAFLFYSSEEVNE